MFKRWTILITITLLLVLSACNEKNEATSSSATPSPSPKEVSAPATEEINEVTGKEAKNFTDIQGVETASQVTAGILFGPDNTMYVAKNEELLKVTPDGSVSTFCSFKDDLDSTRYYYTSPLIWDMTFDNDGNIIAAAQDRILKITPDGKVTTLIEDTFNGFLGTTGIECDKEGNLYITNGGKIEKYTPELEKTIFIDGVKKGYVSFFSLEFDPEGKNVYVSDFYTKSLLKYELDAKGNASDTPEVIVKAPLESVDGPMDSSGQYYSGAPLNITFSKNGTMYVCMDIKGRILKMDTSGKITYLVLTVADTTVANHAIAFGGKGFHESSLYITTLEGKEIYEYEVGEQGLK